MLNAKNYINARYAILRNENIGSTKWYSDYVENNIKKIFDISEVLPEDIESMKIWNSVVEKCKRYDFYVINIENYFMKVSDIIKDHSNDGNSFSLYVDNLSDENKEKIKKFFIDHKDADFNDACELFVNLYKDISTVKIVASNLDVKFDTEEDENVVNTPTEEKIKPFSFNNEKLSTFATFADPDIIAEMSMDEIIEKMGLSDIEADCVRKTFAKDPKAYINYISYMGTPIVKPGLLREFNIIGVIYNLGFNAIQNKLVGIKTVLSLEGIKLKNEPLLLISGNDKQLVFKNNSGDIVEYNAGKNLIYKENGKDIITFSLNDDYVEPVVEDQKTIKNTEEKPVVEDKLKKTDTKKNDSEKEVKNENPVVEEKSNISTKK